MNNDSIGVLVCVFIIIAWMVISNRRTPSQPNDDSNENRVDRTPAKVVRTEHELLECLTDLERRDSTVTYTVDIDARGWSHADQYNAQALLKRPNKRVKINRILF